ncbi:MAG: type IX secretion system membrane protein PorP/SprF [Bacteroidota bacterium]
MKRIVILIGISLVANLSFSQQIPQYSQYLRNQFMVNPAAAGVYDFVDITMSGRWQWMGVDDAPKTAYLSVASQISKTPRVLYNPSIRTSSGPVRNPEIKTGKLKHAIGGQFLVDQYGAFRRMNISGTYAIHVPVSKNYNISFGTRLGLSNNTFLSDKAQVINVLDPTLGYNDPTYDNFYASNSSKYILDIGAGFYFYSKNMFLGVSADHISKDFVEFGTGTANFNTQIHMNATAGVKFPMGENLTLMPAVLVKYMNPSPISMEGSLQLEYKEWLWLGASYRHKDAVVAMVGLNINKMFKFGYSYDFSISRFNQFSSGGHEIVLGIMLGR